eukprot:Phypoly_transcript_01457.p1 GENE.Phypoly_transcript_01457~~Phypoly_transcript_01457.p1  ORF type:complete len:724 (+),score=105.69 Phypoly_transcript_01457:1121-3292(+)
MATLHKLSFVDNLWDGVEQIKEKTEVGLKSCRDVLDFFKRLANLEEEYAKNINGLLQRYQPSNSNLTLSQGWKGVIAVLDGQASVHKSLSVNFVTNLCHPLQALLKDMENRRKLLVTDSAKQKAELRDHMELVKKAKAKYDRSARDLEAARSELQLTKTQVTDLDPLANKISRLEKNVAAKEAECNSSETQYKLQVQASNTFLESYQEEKWPYILSEFEQFEVTRISFMKANIHNFMGLLKETPAVLESEIQAGLRASEMIDPDVDLQMFIEANKTPKELLSPFVFEPYQAVVPSKSSQSSSRPISQIWDNIRLLGLKEEPKAPSIFGVALTELMEKQQKEEPDLPVPKILCILAEGIISLNGFNTEGLFRLSGSSSEVAILRKQVEHGDCSLPTTDPHVLATIFKQFLRDLPVAVIPTEFYDSCVGNQITPDQLLTKLPPIHRTVLLYILNFLQIFIKPAHLQYNKMTASNLSTIFATILLRSPQKDPSALLAGLTNELTFVEKLIQTAPPLDVEQFPIFAILHQTSKALPPPPTNPASKQAAAITSFAFSPPTSPTSPSSVSSTTLGDVAYSTTTDPSSYTSFEDMSEKDEKDPIDDFENDAQENTAHPGNDELEKPVQEHTADINTLAHEHGVQGYERERAVLGHKSEEHAVLEHESEEHAKTVPTTATTKTEQDVQNKNTKSDVGENVHQLESSGELPEFVFVSNPTQSHNNSTEEGSR